jgi:hypothetical protein
MEDVTGEVAIDALDTGSTATYYFYLVDCLFRGRGPRVVSDSLSWHGGTLFLDTEFAQRGGSVVADSAGQTLLAWNSSITGNASVGRVAQGVIVNSNLPPYDRTLEYVRDGTVHVVADSPSRPYRQVMGR